MVRNKRSKQVLICYAGRVHFPGAVLENKRRRPFYSAYGGRPHKALIESHSDIVREQIGIRKNSAYQCAIVRVFGHSAPSQGLGDCGLVRGTLRDLASVNAIVRVALLEK